MLVTIMKDYVTLNPDDDSVFGYDSKDTTITQFEQDL